MKFFKIILFMALVMPLMLLFSGCFNDAIFDVIKAEEDYIAPFDVVLSENEYTRTVYFPISDTERSFSERFDVNSTLDDVVDDNVTGLTWTRCTSDGFNSMKTSDNCTDEVSKEMTWGQAYTTCDNLVYAGYDDWRLPSISELFTLIYFENTDPANIYVDMDKFPDTEKDPGRAYWALLSRLTVSSDSFDITDYGWVVYFAGGGSLNLQITNFIKKLNYDPDTGLATPSLAFVRCVRGGTD